VKETSSEKSEEPQKDLLLSGTVSDFSRKVGRTSLEQRGGEEREKGKRPCFGVIGGLPEVILSRKKEWFEDRKRGLETLTVSGQGKE